MKEYISLLIAFCISMPLLAQKELNNWFSGSYSGITWNKTRSFEATGLFGTSDAILDGLPTEIIGSPMSTAEGCYSLSDSKGNLLFYSDGQKIYNRKMEVMENGAGMYGDMSSAQSGVILPFPGSKTKFISLSLDACNNTTSTPIDVLAYSIVDMDKNTNGGFEDGAVMEKNIVFTGHPASTLTNESMTAIRHANGRDYWVIAPSKSVAATYLNAWLVTPAGIQNTTPVSTLATTTTNNNWDAATGYIKLTPDGKHFAWGTWGDNRLFFGDFDASTGQFSNIKSISATRAYGVEFSVSGKYLYTTQVNGSGATNGAIKVFDFEALLSADDPSTVAFKSKGNIWAHGAVQLGPDKRIYINRRYDYKSDRSIYVIDNPEDYDNLRYYLLEDFISGDAYIGGTLYSGAGGFAMGLPSFTASWFDINIEGNEKFCQRTLQKYTIGVDEYLSNAEYIIWNWGDGNKSPIQQISTGVQSYSASHVFDTGKYTITVEAYKDGETDPFIFHTLDVEATNCGIPVNPHLQIGIKN